MLLADAPAQVVELGGIAGGLLGLAGAVVSGLFAWLMSRDKARFDGQLMRLELANESLRQREDRCQRELAEVRAECKDMRAKQDSIIRWAMSKGMVPPESVTKEQTPHPPKEGS